MTPFCRSAAACAVQALIAALVAQPASAQESQRIEITGSSIKRIDAETALPVQVLTRQDIQKSGATNVEQHAGARQRSPRRALRHRFRR